MEAILFLPPVYLLVIVVAGILIGTLFGKIVSNETIYSSALLFLAFTSGQLLFRVILDDEPGRLVGQIIYYSIFLTTLWLTKYTIKRLR